MQARIKWIEGMAWLAEADSGHALVLDGAPDIGGRNVGVRPMEAVLMGLGGCTAIDVKLILQKSQQQVTDCIIEIEAARADTEPKVFTKIHLHFIVSGHELNEKHVKRAIDLSAEKYCSVSHMLNKTAEITHDYTIRSA